MRFKFKALYFYLKLRLIVWQQRETLDAFQIMQETLSLWQKNALDAQRATRDIAVAWRLSLEHPGMDMRDDLDQLIGDLSDSVAQLEEQIVV